MGNNPGMELYFRSILFGLAPAITALAAGAPKWAGAIAFTMTMAIIFGVRAP